MITFLISILLLVAAYFTYGKFIEKHIGADYARKTPAITMADGVDYKELSPWRIFIIQFLNIAGLGPIFGAIMGAAYGPIAYLWIVFGCIFMGAVHDYLSGMLSIRNSGKSLSSIIGKYLGPNINRIMLIVLALLLLAVGASFVNGPADLLKSLTGNTINIFNHDFDLFYIWLYIIFGYYIIATLLPIDKIIGKIYPYMGGALLFMALSIGIMVIVNGISGDAKLIELTPETFHNYKSNASEYKLIPMLFIVISCGAISGFHGTQSPMMARCLGNEKYGRKIFYGAMIAEGIVACIWATAAMALFNGPEGLNAAADGTLNNSGSMLSANGLLSSYEGVKMNPATIVDVICKSWLGKAGAIIAIIGVVVCPITSGDTAFRSLRLIFADAFKFSQKPIRNRLIISIPIFVIAFIICNVDFSVIWTYVGIGNQLLAAVTLWACSVYFVISDKNHWLVSIPALFLTYICTCYFLIAPNANGGLNLQPTFGYIFSGVVAAIIFALFVKFAIKIKSHRNKRLRQ